MLNGTVKTFQERRIIGEAIWKVPGVFKILNLLKVSNPKTAGPQILKATRMIDKEHLYLANVPTKRVN
jgi:hypothetical protein